MQLEDQFVALMLPVCPRFFPTTAPAGTATPYAVWQHIGGTPLRFFDNTPGDKRNAFIQITVWHTQTKAAFTMIRAMEDALCSATDKLTVNPQGEPIDAYDDSGELCGAVQAFSIWGLR